MRPYLRGCWSILLTWEGMACGPSARAIRRANAWAKGAGRFAFRSRFALRSPQSRTSGLPRVVQGLSGKRHAAMRCHCGQRKEAVAGLDAVASVEEEMP
jgi:hypothetical protein